MVLNTCIMKSQALGELCACWALGGHCKVCGQKEFAGLGSLRRWQPPGEGKSSHLACYGHCRTEPGFVTLRLLVGSYSQEATGSEKSSDWIIPLLRIVSSFLLPLSTRRPSTNSDLSQMRALINVCVCCLTMRKISLKKVCLENSKWPE